MYKEFDYLFVWLNALISETTGPIRNFFSKLDSPFIEEDYVLLYIIEQSISEECCKT